MLPMFTTTCPAASATIPLATVWVTKKIVRVTTW